MKKVLLLFVSCLMFPDYVISQGIIQWQNTIGGTIFDYLYSGQQTNDGGYILGGWSRSNISGDKTENNIDTTGGTPDFWIVKTDSLGNIKWQNTIGGFYIDGVYSLQQTSDGGYILGGRSTSNISGDKTENNIGFGDYWILKTDSLGNIQWQNTIGGSLSEEFNSIQQTSDGGYILAGVSKSNISGDKSEDNIDSTGHFFDYWIVKTDSSGNIQWQNTIGGNSTDVLYSIQQTADGGYFLGGTSYSSESGDKMDNNIDSTEATADFWIVKTDSLGNIKWQKTIGGSDHDALFSIQQTVDKGYILAGVSKSNISGDKSENCYGDFDYWIVKTDSLGNIQWENTIGGNDLESLNSVHQTSDGGYILGGVSNSNISGDKTENNIGISDYWVIKTDSMGIIQWQNTIGGNFSDWLTFIKQTFDGGYILGGSSSSDISGDKTENCIGGYDYWIVKLYPDVITGISDVSVSGLGIIVYPNPATDELMLSGYTLQPNGKTELKVYDVLGKEIFSTILSAYNYKLITTGFASGVYFIRAGNACAKFIRQ